MKLKLITAIIALISLWGCSNADSGKKIVSVENGQFLKNGIPQYYVGTNFWYGPILASDGEGGNIGRLVAELDTLKAIGITNLRVLVGGDGPDGIATRVTPTLQKEAGVYNDTLFVGLDRFLVELGKRDMSAVLFLNNSWEWSGGYGTYLEWAGAGKALIPLIDGYGPFMEQVSHFLTNDKAKELFANHVQAVVGRVNSITGKPYSEDPAIFSWQIGNEPRCFSADPANRDAFVNWLAATAAQIKSIDPNHMVSSGNEGYMGCELDWDLTDRVNAISDIDYMTIHIWPYNWSWITKETTSADLDNAIAMTDEYINMHLEIAAKYDKPLVVEEFGFPRDGMQFAQGTPTTKRDAFYTHVFGRIAEARKEGGRFAGLNFWGWGGLASQNPSQTYWQRGDDYCCDPGQEEQGLNSVYVTDESTIAVIKSVSSQLVRNVSASCEPEVFVGDGKKALNINLSCNSPVKSVSTVEMHLVRDLSLMAESQDTVLSVRKVMNIPAGAGKKVVVPMPVNVDPGFYQVRISWTDNTGKYDLNPFNIGVNPEEIISEPDAPEDFDAFWEANLAELAAVPMEAKLTLLPEHSNDVRNVYCVEMKSLGGATIGGYYAEPVAEGQFPAYIEYMGYGAEPFIYDPSANPEAIEFLVSVRNQGIFLDTPRNWCDRGLDSKENYYYKGAFCDVVRAVDFIASRTKTDQNRIFAKGESQGGAFTFVSASLDHRLRAITPAVPFLGDYEDYGRIVSWPVWEIYEAADAQGISRTDLLEMLKYFDVKNFTSRIECPVYMSFGLQDPTCPPHTNFSEYNQVRSEKQYWCAPYCGHAMWLVKEWSEIRDQYFKSFE